MYCMSPQRALHGPDIPQHAEQAKTPLQVSQASSAASDSHRFGKVFNPAKWLLCDVAILKYCQVCQLAVAG